MKRLLNEVPGREIVLQVGAEGGSLTIVRYHVSGEKWQFAFIRDESTIASFLVIEDLEGLLLFEALDSIATFEDAIALMNKYPWPDLYPLVVHPEYANRVREIIERPGWDPRAKDRWKDILGSEIPDRGSG